MPSATGSQLQHHQCATAPGCRRVKMQLLLLLLDSMLACHALLHLSRRQQSNSSSKSSNLSGKCDFNLAGDAVDGAVLLAAAGVLQQ